MAPEFESAINKSKAGKYGAAVYVYSPEEYAKMKLFQTPDGNSGFAIKEDGDIVSVFSSGGGKVFPMLQLALEHGGTKLDAFDTALTKMYKQGGFTEVSRTPWLDEYMPPQWNKETFGIYNNGEPDVVYMEYKK